MSVRIRKKDLTADQSLLIVRYLLFTPKKTYHNNNRGYPQTETAKPVLFFNETSEYIDLPMAFGSKLLGKPVNQGPPRLKVPINFKPDKKLFDIQIEPANEALSKLKNFGGVHLGLYPGFGKTITSTWLTSQLKLLTLIFANRTNLIPQWKKAFHDFTDARVFVVGEENIFQQYCQSGTQKGTRCTRKAVGGTKWCKQHYGKPLYKPSEGDLAKEKADRDKPISVIICMKERFGKLPQSVKEKIGIVIVDESHNFCTENSKPQLLGCQPEYFISCSATLSRNDGMEKMIQSIVGNNFIFLKSKKPFDIYEVRTGFTVSYAKNKMGNIDYTKLITDISNVKARNDMIINMVTSMPDKKILLLTERAKHAFYLRDRLIDIGEKVDILAGSKNTYKDSRILVGTYRKIGEGFDEANFCADFNGIRLNTLFLCTSFKSKTMLEQICGRVFRAEFPTIYDFVDSVGIFKNHFTKRKSWYIQRGGKYRLCDVIEDKED